MSHDGSNPGDPSAKTALRRVAALSHQLAQGGSQPAAKYGHELQQDLESHGPGVLVYGLEEHGREPLRRTWNPRIDDPQTSVHPFAKTRDLLETQGTVTVDTLNNRSWREFSQRGAQTLSIFGADKAYRKPEPELRQALEEFQGRETEGLGTQAQGVVADFQKQLLAHPRYSPFRIKTENPHDLIRKENLSDPSKAMFRAQTIRACKFGIEYGQLEGRKVLFELAGLDSASAAGKTNVGRVGSGGTQLRSITNSELRKAFRHDTAEASLQFYREGQRVPAPWESGEKDRGAWTSYLGKRLDKYQQLGLRVDWAKAGAAGQAGYRARYREYNQQIAAFKAQAKAAPKATANL